MTDSTFAVAGSGRRYEFGATGRLTVANPNGTSETYERVEPWKPTAAESKAFVGRYTSDEAETELKVVVSGPDLKMTRRPDTTLTLRPVYKDAFTAEGLGLVRFRRDQSGRVTGLSVTTGQGVGVEVHKAVATGLRLTAHGLRPCHACLAVGREA